MIPPLFNVLVYAQIPAWILLYHYGPKNLEYFQRAFYYLWIGFLSFFLILPIRGIFNINIYPIHLLLYYGLCVIVAYYVVGRNGWIFKERVALTFLIVFFSSYFWEFPLHILDLLSFGITSRFILQSSHLIPIYLFSMIWKVQDRKKLINWILIAQMITTGILALELAGYLESLYWTYLIRASNFVILLYILFSNKILIQKKEGD